jgi:hypothetical protein
MFCKDVAAACFKNHTNLIHIRRQNTESYHLLFTLVRWEQKATLALRPLLIYCASLFVFQTILIRPPELSGNNQQKHLAVKQEKVGEELDVEFCL